MRSRDIHRRCYSCSAPSPANKVSSFVILLFSLLSLHSAPAQTQSSPAPAPRDKHPTSTPASPNVHSITEDELKQQLVGKTFYLRGGYLDSSLQFDDHGRLINDSARTSYTLSLVQIDKVSLSKHKVQLEGIRYGLHFLGAGPTEDPLQASDKVRITPKRSS